MSEPFNEATRVSTGFLTALERRCLIWLADRIPPRINSDHLTALALVAMFMTGVSYWLAREHRLALVSAVVWLALNWLGDSLDGTLARVRQRQRPRYGFYVDHVLDTFGVLFVLGGLALSGYMRPFVAAGVLIAYYILSIELFLATYCLSTFCMSFWKLGPTELRILLAAGTLALLFDPKVTMLGEEYGLFDVGGIVATGGLTLTALVSAAGHAHELYLAEPLPGAVGKEA
ncbi:MAG: CDP-alcohol phosphatidyltransferase family protein [Acidobacteria bacterium]|nr:CDP-alcohol phosphatidyltransferase family protein [Acidobacteriota bacterium]